MATEHDMGHMEETGRRHSGIFGIVQTVIAGLLLLLGSVSVAILRDSNSVQIEQTKQIARIEGGMVSVNAQIAAMQTQLAGIGTISERLTRIETELQDDRRRINEIEQARKLR